MVCTTRLQHSASKAINRYLTIRNWLIDFHIVEFEQNGEYSARYGQRLVEEMAKALDAVGLSVRSLKLLRQFYFTYPQIVQTASAQLNGLKLATSDKLPGPIGKTDYDTREERSRMNWHKCMVNQCVYKPFLSPCLPGLPAKCCKP
ncbi:DUF1016 N-terminal domain-containing protein [Dyadobacter jiangsuensis]|nr:DUF1016 N-terminal domain-containing protein [Dyadobacter jiangsuensis]